MKAFQSEAFKQYVLRESFRESFSGEKLFYVWRLLKNQLT